MRDNLSITEALRQAINESGIPYLTLEQQTGVLRQSLMKFARGERTIRLDAADKLARYFGLELRPVAAKVTTEAASKRTRKQGN